MGGPSAPRRAALPESAGRGGLGRKESGARRVGRRCCAWRPRRLDSGPRSTGALRAARPGGMGVESHPVPRRRAGVGALARETRPAQHGRGARAREDDRARDAALGQGSLRLRRRARELASGAGHRLAPRGLPARARCVRGLSGDAASERLLPRGPCGPRGSSSCEPSALVRAPDSRAVPRDRGDDPVLDASSG